VTVIGLIVRVLLVAVIAAAVGIGALFFSRSQPTKYQASTKISFSSALRPEIQVLGAPFVRPNIDQDVFTATNAQWVASRHVARMLAAEQPGLGLTEDQIAGRMSVSPIAGTEIVAVRATGNDRRDAELLARSYTAMFEQWFDDRQKTRARAVQEALRTRYENLTRAQRRTGTGATLRDQISALDVLAKVGSGSPEVVEAAHASGSPQQPQTRRNVIFGIVFGLAVGIGLVSLRSQLRPRSVTEP
jgi:capsular polysaccharide biosynthesis protein